MVRKSGKQTDPLGPKAWPPFVKPRNPDSATWWSEHHGRGMNGP